MQLTPPTRESEDPISDTEVTSSLTEQSPDVLTEQEGEMPQPKRFSWKSLTLDSFLVIITFGILGGGAYYLQKELQHYYIPSPLEQEQARSDELFKRIEELQQPAYIADENIRLRQKLEGLQREQAQLDKSLSAAHRERDGYQERIIAQQKALLRALSDAKRLAKQQIGAGLRIGTLTTLDGRVFNDCRIRRIVGQSLVISHSAGQAPFNIDSLSPDSLPRLVRFALGMENLMETSDLLPNKSATSSNAQADVTPIRRANLSLPKPPAPVIDTAPVAPARNSQPSTPAGDRWVAPTGDLPF